VIAKRVANTKTHRKKQSTKWFKELTQNKTYTSQGRSVKRKSDNIEFLRQAARHVQSGTKREDVYRIHDVSNHSLLRTCLCCLSSTLTTLLTTQCNSEKTKNKQQTTNIYTEKTESVTSSGSTKAV
jgi:hypothetical protein